MNGHNGCACKGALWVKLCWGVFFHYLNLKRLIFLHWTNRYPKITTYHISIPGVYLFQSIDARTWVQSQRFRRPAVSLCHSQAGLGQDSSRAPAALQVYGEDLFKPTDMLLRRLTEFSYQDREHPGVQLRCNQGDSLYIYHSERVAVMTMHVEVCQDADEKEVTGECKIFSSSSHNDASSSDVQVGTLASYVEEPAFRFFFPKHHFYQYGIHPLNFKNW